jgi:hypothetical protein
MNSSSNDPLAALRPGATAIPMGAELRAEDRVQTVYLPCCLRVGQHCTVGMIRNISASGLMVETTLDAEPGTEIDYFQESGRWCRARVMWRDGRHMGLLNVARVASEPSRYPHRAIRIPTTLIGRIWLGGRSIEVAIANISLNGILAFGVPPLDHGQLVTLKIAGREFANTSVRWWDGGSAGLKFERPVTFRKLTELIELAGQRGAGFYYERRIAEVLEVVAANSDAE